MPIVKIKYDQKVEDLDLIQILRTNLPQLIIDALKTTDVELSRDNVDLDFKEAHRYDIGRNLRILVLATDYPERVENVDKRSAWLRGRVKELIGDDSITVATPIMLVKFGISGG